MPRVYEELRDYITWAVPTAFAVAFAFLAVSPIRELAVSAPALAFLSAVLLVVTILAFLWYARAVRKELDLLATYFDERRKVETRGQVLLIALGLAIAFGCLMAATPYISIYTALLVVYQGFDIWGNWTAMANLSEMYELQMFRGHRGRKGAEILYEYYFRRPLILRCTVLMIVYFGAFAAAMLGSRNGQPILQYLAYGIVITAIPVGEWVISGWRQQRDLALKRLSGAETARSVERV